MTNRRQSAVISQSKHVREHVWVCFVLPESR